MKKWKWICTEPQRELLAEKELELDSGFLGWNFWDHVTKVVRKQGTYLHNG